MYGFTSTCDRPCVVKSTAASSTIDLLGLLIQLHPLGHIALGARLFQQGIDLRIAVVAFILLCAGME